MTYPFPIIYPKTTYEIVNFSVEKSFTTGHTDIFKDDSISFMDTFVFPDLEKVKTSLEKSKYSKKEINEIVTGLKTLIEHKCD